MVVATEPRELTEQEFRAYLERLRNAQPPAPFENWEQYREYQSWRIDMQMIAIYLRDWHQAKPEDKGTCQTHVLNVLKRANLKAETFPQIDLPRDIINPFAKASDSRAPDAQPEFLNLPDIAREVTRLFGNVTFVGITKTE